MITGKLINLRTVRQADLDELFSITSDISQKGEYWPLNLQSESGFKKSFADTGFWSDNSGTMIITDKNNRIIGEVNYFKGLWYMPGYEIGYQIYRTDDRGKGFMTEALKIFTSYFFEVKQINRLEIEVISGNIPSRRIAEKCGFKFEGVKKQALYSKGRYVDMELFALLRADCPAFR